MINTKNSNNLIYQYGFTLIELLVVIAIIGILSSVVLASLSGARESARVTRIGSDLQQIETAMTMWMDATDRTQWPTSNSLTGESYPSIQTVVDNTTLGEYLTSVPEPPFGNTQYIYDNSNEVFNCGDPEHEGVVIRVNNLRDNQELFAQINNVVEGDTKGDGSQDLDCGQLRRHDGFDHLYFSLSNDGKL